MHRLFIKSSQNHLKRAHSLWCKSGKVYLNYWRFHKLFYSKSSKCKSKAFYVNTPINSHIEFGATVSMLKCNSVKCETQTATPYLCFYSQSNINILIKCSFADLSLSCPQVCALCNIGSRYYWIFLSLSRIYCLDLSLRVRWVKQRSINHASFWSIFSLFTGPVHTIACLALI